MNISEARKAIADFDAMTIASSYCTQPESFVGFDRKHVLEHYIRNLPDFAFDQLRLFLAQNHGGFVAETKHRLKSLGIEP